MKEQFRKIPSLKLLYEVNKHGTIRNVKSKKIKSHWIGSDGYEYISTSVEGVKKNNSVHRLVAEVWCKNPNGYTEVNHKDENIRNNDADNLEWCTREYNVKYGTAFKRQAKTKHIYTYYANGIEIGTLYDCVEYVKNTKGITSKNQTINKHILQATNGYKSSDVAYGIHWSRK